MIKTNSKIPHLSQQFENSKTWMIKWPETLRLLAMINSWAQGMHIGVYKERLKVAHE